MNKTIIVLLLAVLITFCYAQNPRAVTKERIVEWHDKLYESTNAMNAPGGGSSGLRGWAMMVTAMHDALNIIEDKNTPYAVSRQSLNVTFDVTDAEPLAAVAKAAQTVLDGLFTTPTRRYSHLAQFAIQTGQLPRNSRTANGVTIGQKVGELILANRANDGHPPQEVQVVNGTLFDEYIYGTPYFPGRPNSPGYPQVRPFAIPSYTDARFSIPAPPARDSAQFVEEWKELYRYGLPTSNPQSARTVETDNIARFHDGNFGSQIGWVMDVLMTTTIDLEGLDLLRVLALTAISSHDSHAAHWHYKYFFRFSRPITAYRLVPADNALLGAEKEPNWTPLLTTSQTPEYPSGHAARTGGVVSSFIKAFGDVPPGGSFRSISFTQPGLGFRSYTSFREFQAEVQISRTFGGVHWRASGNAGFALAQSVTEYVWNNILQPKSL